MSRSALLATFQLISFHENANYVKFDYMRRMAGCIFYGINLVVEGRATIRITKVQVKYDFEQPN